MLNTLAWIGPETMALVVVAILVLFGGKKIPELMRGVGQGVGELKRGMEEGKQTLIAAAHAEAPVTPPAATVPAEPVVEKPASSSSIS